MTLIYINDTATIDDKEESSLPLSPRRWSNECELYNKLESRGEVNNIWFSFRTPTPEKCDDLLRFYLKGCSLSIGYDIYKVYRNINFYMLINQLQRPSYYKN